MKLWVLGDRERDASTVWGKGVPRELRGAQESRLTEEILSRVLLVIRILGEVVDFLAHSSEGSWGDTSQETFKSHPPRQELDVPHGASAAAAPGGGLSLTPNTALGPRGRFAPCGAVLLRPPSTADSLYISN